MAIKPDADTDDPAIAYEFVRETYGIDDRNDFETFLEAVDGAETVLEIHRELRESRASIKAALSRLGLSWSFHAFPPADLDERLETLREGPIPDTGGDLQ